MFILELTYTATLDRIDALLAEHVDWLRGHYAAGVFVASGRKVPRDGGVIVAVGDSRERIEEIVEGDPFVLAGVAEYRVTEFLATTTAPALETYRQQLPA
ncbi:YciI family protein [Kitasatospora sp. NPDC085895]|uniref:YciI family protein n=1 Tax=Kitasatospora sp. NPDC085895 TaxID=3155057 RepID=UPI00344D9883